jgi:hypothetical protein
MNDANTDLNDDSIRSDQIEQSDELTLNDSSLGSDRVEKLDDSSSSCNSTENTNNELEVKQLTSFELNVATMGLFYGQDLNKKNLKGICKLLRNR